MPVPAVAEEQEHTSAVSGTPTAWMTLGLLVLMVTVFLTFDSISCGMLRAGLKAVSWWHGDDLRMVGLTRTDRGWFEARGVEFLHGDRNHRSSWRADTVRVQFESLANIIGREKNKPRRLIRELQIGASKALIDRRGTAQPTKPGSSEKVMAPQGNATGGTWDLLPAACSLGPMDAVMIGENYRMEVRGLNLRLPEQWAGKISYNEAVVDIGNWHRGFSKTSATAYLEDGILRIGTLDLGKQMELRKLTLAPREGGVEFGISAMLGGGQLRGDGVLGIGGNPHHLEVTLVGENLNLAAFNQVMQKEGAAGTVSQARLTFRGETTRPMDAESSLRLIAHDVHWQGLDWETFRVAATMTGRNLTLSELDLQQQGNEVVAEGQSQLPADWRQTLHAPFTARFHADLADVHALSSLLGTPLGQISGALYFEGQIQGSDNKATGYCNVTGSGLKVRELPLDWLKGCLLFQGEKTWLSNLEASSGSDRVYLAGSVANTRPHAYEGHADFAIRNLTQRLTQLGIDTAPFIGSGGVKGSWQGQGSMNSHTGTFQADVEEWVSRWTTTGMTGHFEGNYAPGVLEVSKAEARQDDLKLSWKMACTPRKLDVTSILATREKKPSPLLAGSLEIPLNVADLWQSGDPVRSLQMQDPLAVSLVLHGIDAQELAEALGQKATFEGNLEGNIKVTGTPATPEIHTTLRVARFELPKGVPASDLSVTMEATNGRLSALFSQGSETASPLHLRVEMPFTLTSDQGMLRIVPTTSPVEGDALFKKIPVDGWASLLGWRWAPVLRNALIDGGVTLSGTLLQPDLHGTVTLCASEMHLFGSTPLEKLVIPVTLTNTTVSVTNATAVYGQKPLALSGSGDWSTGCLNGSLHINGTALPLSLTSGIKAVGNTDLLLSSTGTNPPVLGGTIELTAMESSLHPKLSLCFAPPGIAPPYVFTTQATAPSPPALQVDLAIRTPGALAVAEAAGADKIRTTSPCLLSADLHLSGRAESPRVIGDIQIENTRIALPATTFVVPKVDLQLDGDQGARINGEAFGMTAQGLCAFGIHGRASETSIDFQEPTKGNVPGMIRCLSRSVSSTAGPSGEGLLLQSAAWLRQEMLFPDSADFLMPSQIGRNQRDALGFYGTPWILNWEISQPNTR